MQTLDAQRVCNVSYQRGGIHLGYLSISADISVVNIPLSRA